MKLIKLTDVGVNLAEKQKMRKCHYICGLININFSCLEAT